MVSPDLSAKGNSNCPYCLASAVAMTNLCHIVLALAAVSFLSGHPLFSCIICESNHYLLMLMASICAHPGTVGSVGWPALVQLGSGFLLWPLAGLCAHTGTVGSVG